MSPEAWSFLVGLFVPILVQAVKTRFPESWPDWGKLVIALSCSVVIGLGSAYFQGELVWAWAGILGNIAAVFSASQIAFKVGWQPVFGW